MSSSDQNNNNLPPVNQQQDGDDNNEEKKLQQEKKDEKKDDKNKQDWRRIAQANNRGAIDVAKRSLYTEHAIDQTKTLFQNLPTVPSFIQETDLITTGSNDFKATVDDLFAFFTNHELLEDRKFYLDGSNIHGSYHNADLCANSRFSCYLYRTVDGDIAFHLTRVDGCGIAFARLFSALNKTLGNNKQREICTFEAPPLLNSLQINTLETQYSNLSLSNQDSCVFEHGIQSPMEWSTQTLDNMFASMYKLHCKNMEKGTAIMIPSEEIIVPSDDNDEDLELPLPPKAQAHMITQSFDMLNGALMSIQDVDVWVQNQPQECQALQKFTEGLFTQQDNSDYTHIVALLNHPSLDVVIASLAFLNIVLPARQDLVDRLPVTLLEDLLTGAQEVVQNHNSEPFEYINYQTIVESIEILNQLRF